MCQAVVKNAASGSRGSKALHLRGMITTLTGANAYLVKTELGRVVQAFVAEHGDLALERFEGSELSFETLRDAVQGLPFLAARKLVVVQDVNANKELTERFDQVVGLTGETTDLVIVETKLDKRSAYYKLLKSKTDYRELAELDERALGRWLVSEAEARGGSLQHRDAQLMVDRIGPNQMMLSGELDKVLSYNPVVTADTIRLLVEPTPQSSIFDLLDAAFRGDTAKALALYEDQRRQKVEPQQILAMFAWQLHILAVVKAGGQRSPEEIAKQAKLNPFVVRKTQGLTGFLTLPQIKRLVTRVTDIDRRLKGEALDADEAISFVLLTVHTA